jgi:hypothetical protein
MNTILNKSPIQSYFNIDTTKTITHQLLHVTPTRSFILGAGLYYSVSIEKYWHIPLVILFPSAYAGYHSFKNKEIIRKYINEF